MTRAVVPHTMPQLGEATEWRAVLCGMIRLDRHKSEPARHLGDLQYWGVCPCCYRKAGND